MLCCFLGLSLTPTPPQIISLSLLCSLQSVCPPWPPSPRFLPGLTSSWIWPVGGSRRRSEGGWGGSLTFLPHALPTSVSGCGTAALSTASSSSPRIPVTFFSSSAVASSPGPQVLVYPLNPPLTSVSGPFLRVPESGHSRGAFCFLPGS